jgi:hypothetical protein
MNAKRLAGTACLILAVLLSVSGVVRMSRGGGPAVGDASGLGVSRAVGMFLPGVILAIVGVALLQRPRDKS